MSHRSLIFSTGALYLRVFQLGSGVAVLFFVFLVSSRSHFQSPREPFRVSARSFSKSCPDEERGKTWPAFVKSVASAQNGTRREITCLPGAVRRCQTLFSRGGRHRSAVPTARGSRSGDIRPWSALCAAPPSAFATFGSALPARPNPFKSLGRDRRRRQRKGGQIDLKAQLARLSQFALWMAMDEFSPRVEPAIISL